MTISFSNLLVREICKEDISYQSFLSFGEKYKYSVVFYLMLKKFLNAQFECPFTINSLFEYMCKSFGDILKVEEDSKTKPADKYKRQKQYFKDFLKKLLYTEMFTMSLQYSGENKAQIIEDAVDGIVGSNKLIVLSLNKEKETYYGFTIVDEEEVIKILNYSDESNVDNLKLLNLYCYIASRIYQPSKNDERVTVEQYKYCLPTYDNIAADGVLTKKTTIKEYADNLVKLDMIRYQGPGEMYREEEKRNGAYHYILVKDYPDYSEDDYDLLFKSIVSGYKKTKRDEGWHFVGSKKKDKTDVKLTNEIEQPVDQDLVEECQRLNYEQIPDDVRQEYEKPSELIDIRALLNEESEEFERLFA